MKHSKRIRPEHCKRVKLIGFNKYGSVINFNCPKSSIKWDGTDRVVNILNCKLDFLE